MLASTLLTSSPAHAAYSDVTNKTVSCSAGTYTTIASGLGHTGGTVRFFQNDTNSNLDGRYHWQSANGNNLPAKVASDGETVAWTNVNSGTYKVWHTAHVNKDCNGSSLGNGNTKLWGRAFFV